MKVYISSENFSTHRNKTIHHTIVLVLFVLFEIFYGGNFIIYIFFVFNLFCLAFSAYFISFKIRNRPLLEYDENGITQFFIKDVYVSFSDVELFKYSDHEFLFIKKDGFKASTVRKKWIPHKDFDEMLSFFKDRLKSEYVP